MTKVENSTKTERLSMRVRLFASLIALLAFTSSIVAQSTISITGSVEFDEPSAKMEIFRMDGPEKIVLAEFDIDENGKFEYNLKVDRPGLLTLDCKKWERVNFWAEDENIHIDFRGRDTARVMIKNPRHYYIQNSGPNNELINFYNFLSWQNYQQMIGISQAAYRIKLAKEDDRQEVTGKFYDLLRDDYLAHIKNLAALYSDRNSAIALLPLLKGEENGPLYNKIVDALREKHGNYPPLEDFLKQERENRERQERVKIGAVAPEFNFPTPDGKNHLSPSSFRGKILLIDFWASWCGPCRAEFPNLKEAYEKYADQGVEFLSVSVDTKVEAWHKALKEESMPWPQILAPNSGKEVMELYQFSGIPFIILLDREGRIVAKHLRGKNLHDEIEKYL